MLSPKQFRDYQKDAAMHQLYHDLSMLWLGCGRGKTVISLTTIEHRIRAGLVNKVLVFAPLRVCHAVWAQEARKWDHTQDLRFSVIGWPTEKKRLRHLFCDADIYLCNYENMGWLSNTLKHYYLDRGEPLPFDMVVYDEITRVKDSTTQRIRGGSSTRTVKNERITKRIEGWRKMIPHFKYATGLTGTPAPNGYLDLHGQYLVIDGGQRLGEYVTHFKDNYFAQGYDGWTYEATEVGRSLIEQKISDITIQMDDLPSNIPVLYNNVPVELPEKVMEQYREVEQDMYTQLDDGTEIELFNRASVSNKCLQFADGAAYREPNEPEWTEIHKVKLEALDSIIEEAGGNCVLVGYRFRADAERIMHRYKSLNPINLTKTPAKDLESVLNKGRKGQIKLMVGHPASLGHGVDGLQDFCWNLAWFGIPWSLELYIQMIGRIAAGERLKRPVTIHRILAADTIDVAVADALLRKDGDQRGLQSAINRYRQGLIPRDGSISFM